MDLLRKVATFLRPAALARLRAASRAFRELLPHCFDLFMWRRMQALVQEGLTLTAAAARAGYVDALRWALPADDGHALFPSVTATTAANTPAIAAALAGHLHILRWLAKRGVCVYNYHTCSGAAAAGHLNVIQWLHRRAPGDWIVCCADKAALEGHLHILKWLHRKFGSLDNSEACLNAAIGGQLHVILALPLGRVSGGGGGGQGPRAHPEVCVRG
jgi:hypothetical protein